jgi:probable rRNA maturation factor
VTPANSGLEVGLTVNQHAPGINDVRLIALLELAASTEGRSGEVGIWICTDDEIAALHQRYMDIAGPTDVLSFPGDAPYLGDIAVSYETAAAQARDVGHAVQREIAYLTLHGLLHLIGYDDLIPEDRQRMIARQDELIARVETDLSDEWE